MHMHVAIAEGTQGNPVPSHEEYKRLTLAYWRQLHPDLDEVDITVRRGDKMIAFHELTPDGGVVKLYLHDGGQSRPAV